MTRVRRSSAATTARTLAPLLFGESIATVGTSCRVGSNTTKLTITKSDSKSAAFHEKTGKFPGVNPSLVSNGAGGCSVDVVTGAMYIVEWCKTFVTRAGDACAFSYVVAVRGTLAGSTLIDDTVTESRMLYDSGPRMNIIQR